MLLVGDLGPEGMPDRCRCPRHECLAEALWPLAAPGPPGRLPAAVGDWGTARIFLPGGGGGIAGALFAKGAEEAGGATRPGAWEGWEAGEGGMGLGPLRDGGVKGGDSMQGDAEWGHQGLDGCDPRYSQS